MITTRKSIRKIVFGFLVAGLAMLGSAFTNNLHKSDPEPELSWFELEPGGNPLEQDDYTMLTVEPVCEPGGHICAIKAEEDINNSGKPDLETIQSTKTRVNR